MKRLLRDRTAVLGLSIIVLLVLCAIFAGVLARFPAMGFAGFFEGAVA